ncbi:MAG: hypothetical protein M3374_00940 [Pseudomonadota bacterium]|nr:hypothetical protein [Pseudomonadota bacterium]
MPTSSARLVSLILLAAFMAGAGNAMAQRGRDDDKRGERAERGQDAPARGQDRRDDHRALSDAVRRVERRTGGEVLSAERVPFDGRDVSRVKVIDTKGRVRIYMDDPRDPSPQPPRTRRDDD